MERDEECTFMPDTSKHTSRRHGAPHAKLSLSGEVSIQVPDSEAYSYNLALVHLARQCWYSHKQLP
jgi:hypothetical protein